MPALPFTRRTRSLVLMQQCAYDAYFIRMFANSEEHYYAGVIVVGVQAALVNHRDPITLIVLDLVRCLSSLPHHVNVRMDGLSCGGP